jgi:hypothetical protein
MKSRLFSMKGTPVDHGYDLIRVVEWMATLTGGRDIFLVKEAQLLKPSLAMYHVQNTDISMYHVIV